MEKEYVFGRYVFTELKQLLDYIDMNLKKIDKIAKKLLNDEKFITWLEYQVNYQQGYDAFKTMFESFESSVEEIEDLEVKYNFDPYSKEKIKEPTLTEEDVKLNEYANNILDNMFGESETTEEQSKSTPTDNVEETTSSEEQDSEEKIESYDEESIESDDVEELDNNQETSEEEKFQSDEVTDELESQEDNDFDNSTAEENNIE